MSLDVYLTTDTPVKKSSTGVFVRQEGKTIELTYDQIKERWPESDVIDTDYETNVMYSANITHNLTEMADRASVYYALWRPEERGWKIAKDITPALKKGLAKLKAKPDYFKILNPENGWGSYDGLVSFVEQYLSACTKYPDAKIEVSR